jgi:hypothetical protein
VLPNLLVIDGGLAMTCSFGQTLPRTVHQLQKMAIMLVVEKDVPPRKWVWREKTSCPS